MKKLLNMKFEMAKVATKTRGILTNKKGQGSLETVISILISVVLGGLLLGGLYILFGDTVLPQLTEKISSMFDYAG